MPGDDRQDSFNHIIVWTKIKVSFRECKEARFIAQNRPSSYQTFIVSGLYPGFCRRTNRLVNVNFIRINPKDPVAYKWRAWAYRAVGDGEKAASDERKAQELTK